VVKTGPVVGCGKLGDKLWSFVKLNGSWLAEKPPVSEERLCFTELDIYFMYDIFKLKSLAMQSKE
jgi:hypothetical protein